MALKQIDYGTPLYDQMVALRSEVLRAPLGLEFSSEELKEEKNDILIACTEDEDEILGCCILSVIYPETLRLRQMAVYNKEQGKGIGESIMRFAETLARDKGYKKITMHARDAALGFYSRLGYKVVGEPFTEVGLPHHMMEKVISI